MEYMAVVYKMENVYQKYKGEKIMQMKILGTWNVKPLLYTFS